MEKLTLISSLSRARKLIQNRFKGSRLREGKKEQQLKQIATQETRTTTTTTTTTASTTTTIVNNPAVQPVESTNLSPSSRETIKSVPSSPSRNDERIIANTNAVINDLSRNINIQKNHRRWNPITLSVFGLVFLTSFSAYKLLSRSICAPSTAKMYSFVDTYKALDIDRITNLERIPDLLLEYRRDNSINKSVIIPGVLAVDAVSLTPHITVDDKGNIKGLIENVDIKLNEEELENLKSMLS